MFEEVNRLAPGSGLRMLETSDEAAMSVIEDIRSAIEELVTDMRQVQWRLARLERQFGAPRLSLTGKDTAAKTE
jgi:hypothetical protein